MSRKKSRSNFSDAEIRGFINFAFHDYIASRTLLQKGLASQGSILGITAMEKLLKAICLLYEEEIVVGGGGHSLAIMVDKVKAKDSTLFTDDDEKFLKFINKAYKLRYPDNLDSEFVLNLPSLKILENLDKVFCRLTESDKIIELNPDKKMYDAYKSKNNPLLINKNVHFDSQLKNKLSEENQKYAIYESDGKILKETFCWSNTIKHDDKWE